MIDLEALAIELAAIAVVALVLWVVFGVFGVRVVMTKPTPEPTTLVCESAAIHPRNGGGYIVTLECPPELLPITDIGG